MSEELVSQLFVVTFNEDLRDVFETIAETMREIVCGIDPPLVVCTMVRRGEHAICDKVPHHRVAGLKILLHSKDRLPWLVHAALHLLELSKRFFNWSCPVSASFPRATLLATPVREDFLRCKTRKLSV